MFLEADRVASHHPSVVDLEFVGPRVGLARSEGRGVAQPGSAPGSGPGGRWFKSNRPDQRRSSTLHVARPSDAPVAQLDRARDS